MSKPDAANHLPTRDHAELLMERTGIPLRDLATTLGLSERTLRCYKAQGKQWTAMPYVVQFALEALVNARRRADGRRSAGADTRGV